ncbi:MAG: glycosyltransferase family 2 protein [Acidobacteriota bacterium]
MAKVSIIVVNYNGRHVLGELFESLVRQTYPADEVIMVDNASSDGSVGLVRDRFPWVKVVVSPTNTGFAEGNNIGLANAHGEYVALLNNDTVVDEQWLAQLTKALDEDERVGAAVSKIYLAADESIIDCAGAEFNNLGLVWGRGSNQLDEGQFDSVSESPSLTACAALLRRSALRGAPLFDRRLFMYYEEFDLALRLRGHGYTIRYIPTSVVHHKRSQAVKGATTKAVLFQQFYGNRNRIKIVMKYYPPMVLLLSMPLILLSLAYWDWRFLREGGPRLFLRALAAQTQYAMQGLFERLRGNTVSPEAWLPWMKHQSLRQVLALKSALGAYVE